MTENKIRNFSLNTLLTETKDAKANILHRKFLNYVLEVTKSCPNVAVMGNRGKFPSY